MTNPTPRLISGEFRLEITLKLANHTPGPWVTDGKWVRRASGPGSAGIVFCLDGKVENPFPEGQILANAQLIAAAPDMLEALLFAITEDPGEVIGMGNAHRRLQAITLTAQAAIARAIEGTR